MTKTHTEHCAGQVRWSSHNGRLQQLWIVEENINDNPLKPWSRIYPPIRHEEWRDVPTEDVPTEDVPTEDVPTAGEDI